MRSFVAVSLALVLGLAPAAAQSRAYIIPPPPVPSIALFVDGVEVHERLLLTAGTVVDLGVRGEMLEIAALYLSGSNGDIPVFHLVLLPPSDVFGHFGMPVELAGYLAGSRWYAQAFGVSSMGDLVVGNPVNVAFRGFGG